MLKILGVPFSAHTRKAIVAAHFKQLDFELEPVVPLLPPEKLPQVFVAGAPLRRIPLLVDGDFVLPDSSAIAQYFERLAPTPPLFPSEPRAHAWALWIEEFVDGALATDVLHGVLFQRVFAPRFLGRAPDEALIKRSVGEIIPARLDYLERVLTGPWFAGEAFSYADITVASILINYGYAGEQLDARVHPRLHGFLGRAAKQPALARALADEAAAARDLGAFDLTLLDEWGF